MLEVGDVFCFVGGEEEGGVVVCVVGLVDVEEYWLDSAWVVSGVSCADGVEECLEVVSAVFFVGEEVLEGAWLVVVCAGLVVEDAEVFFALGVSDFVHSVYDASYSEVEWGGVVVLYGEGYGYHFFHRVDDDGSCLYVVSDGVA